MDNRRLSTPVALFLFNRPETTVQVFEAIRCARPPKLLVVADGPRPGIPGEAGRCAAARAVIEHVDWPCDVLTNWSDANLGCKRRVSSGLDWVFETVPEAIVLEDDCLPHTTFFRFCEELLERFRDDTRIAQISGNNFQFGRKRSMDSYYFSRYTHIWGWASWRRAWRNYDITMALWPEIRDGGWLADWLGDFLAVEYWTAIFDKTHRGEINTWDYQFLFSNWVQGALCILPAVNLVTNIGFGTDSTHTRALCRTANVPAEPVAFPLSHPRHFLRDGSADAYTEATVFMNMTPRKRLKKRIRRAVEKWFGARSR